MGPGDRLHEIGRVAFDASGPQMSADDSPPLAGAMCAQRLPFRSQPNKRRPLLTGSSAHRPVAMRGRSWQVRRLKITISRTIGNRLSVDQAGRQDRNRLALADRG
jgi:hypothetical protein